MEEEILSTKTFYTTKTMMEGEKSEIFVWRNIEMISYSVLFFFRSRQNANKILKFDRNFHGDNF